METDERILAILGDRFVPYCGITLAKEADGTIVSRVTVDERHKNANDYVNGGMLYTLADICAGAAISYPEKNIATLDSSFHFLKNVKSGTITCRAIPVRIGRKISVIRTETRSEDGTLLCTGDFTFYRVS